MDLRILRRIAEVTEARGPHAFGFAWIDQKGRLRSFKQAGRISSALGLLGMAEGATMLIGHTRFATHGDPDSNLNNHPHDAGDAWVVHNGVIGNYRAIAEKHKLRLHTECDSEVLGGMIAKFRGKPHRRFSKAASEAMGLSPFAMLALWPDRLMAVRANRQPLHLCQTGAGWWLGSLTQGMPGKTVELTERVPLEFAEAKDLEVAR